jgi:hypothetical protein
MNITGISKPTHKTKSCLLFHFIPFTDVEFDTAKVHYLVSLCVFKVFVGSSDIISLMMVRVIPIEKSSLVSIT